MSAYEVVTWDVRDTLSEEPSSTLGLFPTREQAWEAVVKYLTPSLMQYPYLLKIEVLEVTQ